MINAPIAGKNLRSDEMVTLYTLPTCGICHMIKEKMLAKKINFEERDFTEIAETMGLDRAPVLHIVRNDHEEDYIMSPTKMVEWINKQ